MTVSLTLTFADLAQAEQAIAAIREKATSTIPAGSHGRRHESVEGPEGGTTGQDAPAADPVTVASVAGLNTNSPDQFRVQASAAEDRRTASAATHQPETANEAGRFESGSLTEILVKPQVQVLPGDAFEVAKGGPTGMGRSDSVERHAPKSRERKPLRPHCQSPDDLSKCAGRGREHCHACRKAMAIQSEAA